MKQLFQELLRRNVIRVAIAYLIAAWLLLQITEVLTGLLQLPEALGKVVVAALAIGFPVVVVFAWVFELTPDGIKRESELDRKRSVTGQTGKRLNVLIIVMLALAAGYFFWESRLKSPTAPVQVVNVESPPRAIAEPVDDSTSIAVLPFANMSSDPENEYFADGLSEEILNRLAQVPKLTVIARTSAFAFKGQDRDLREIGALLGTGNILEGSVRRQGNQVRVTAQLIETADGAHLWSQTWDRELDDVFAIQDEIAKKVVDALDIVLDDATRQAMLAAGIRNVDAFVAYQKGYQAYIDAHGQPNMFERLKEANLLFDAAIAAAPDFADAYARKTDYYAHLVMDSELDDMARQAALDTMLDLYDTARQKARDPDRQRAIDLDRTFFTDDWSRLPVLLGEIFANDSCADGNWMELALPFAETSDLMAHYQRQIHCDPMMVLSYAFASDLRLRRGDLDAAQEIVDMGRALGGDHRWLWRTSQDIRLLRGEGEALLEELRQLAAEQSDVETTYIRFRQHEALVLATMDRIEEAKSVHAWLIENAPLSNSELLIMSASVGDRSGANAAAAALDALPGGQAELIRRITWCFCGAPFDLEATPQLASRLREAGFSWPPPTVMKFPAKDW